MALRRFRVSHLVMVAAVLVALGSLYLAWRGSQPERTGRPLADGTPGSSDVPVWRATVDQKESDLVFERESEGRFLHRADVVFASDIGVVATTAEAPNYHASLRELGKAIRDHENRHKTFEPGKVAKYVESAVPVLVVSRYESKGSVHHDTSLYMLRFTAFINKDRDDWPIGFAGLQFAESLTGKTPNEFPLAARLLYRNLFALSPIQVER